MQKVIRMRAAKNRHFDIQSKSNTLRMLGGKMIQNTSTTAKKENKNQAAFHMKSCRKGRDRIETKQLMTLLDDDDVMTKWKSIFSIGQNDYFRLLYICRLLFQQTLSMWLLHESLSRSFSHSIYHPEYYYTSEKRSKWKVFAPRWNIAVHLLWLLLLFASSHQFVNNSKQNFLSSFFWFMKCALPVVTYKISFFLFVLLLMSPSSLSSLLLLFGAFVMLAFLLLGLATLKECNSEWICVNVIHIEKKLFLFRLFCLVCSCVFFYKHHLNLGTYSSVYEHWPSLFDSIYFSHQVRNDQSPIYMYLYRFMLTQKSAGENSMFFPE